MPQLTGKMRKSVIRTAVKRVGADVVLLYRLTEEPAGTPGRFMYSLTVTKADSGVHRRCVEHLHDISRSRREAERIFTLVSRGRVFPDTAAEIVSDLISI